MAKATGGAGRRAGGGRGHAAGRARLERAAVAGGALISLAEAASPGLSPGEVLERVARAAAPLVSGATVHVWGADAEGQALRLAAEAGPGAGGGSRPARTVLGVGEGLAGAVARSPEPVVVPSLRQEHRLVSRAWARAQGFASFAGVRFARGERLLGVLALFTRRRHRFTRQEVGLLRAFAAHAAAAIENALLFETASNRLARLAALTEIGREISQQRDPEVLLALIGRRATELLGGDSASVFLLEPATGHLRPHASFNTGAFIREVAVGPGEGLVGAVALRREGILVNDYPRSPYAIAPFRERDRAVLAQPLLHGDVLYGVLVVRRSRTDGVGRPFTGDDLAQLGDFAVQAAIALESTRRLRLADARAERVKAAAEVGQLLASTRDADRILDLVAEKVRDVLRAEAFGLFRSDPAGRLRYVRGFGLDEAFIREHTLAVGEGVVGRAVAERRTVETADILRDPTIPLSPAARERIERVGSRAIVAVSMLSPDGVLGVLATYHPVGVRIPPEEVEFLETLASHAGAALENARLLAETQRRQASAETLAAVAQTLASSLDLRTVIAGVAEAVRRLLACDGGAIGLAGGDGVIRLSARVGLGSEAFRQFPVRPGEGVTGWVVTHGRPFWTNDYANDRRISPVDAAEIREAGIATLLAVPVRLRDETVGVLYGFHRDVVRVGGEEITLAEDLARVVAIAVANARLYQEARRREAEARALFEVSQLISGTLDPERVSDLIVEKTRELVHVRACGIFRLGEDGRLRYARGAGLSAEFVRNLAVPVGHGTSGRSVAERHPVWTADILADAAVSLPAEVRDLVEREGYRAVLSAPILVQGAPFGCLAAYWWEPHRPTPVEVETLSSLATLAAVALETARLHGETRRHASRLTRLNQVNRAVSASLHLDEVLGQIAQAAGTFFDAPLANLWIAEEGRRRLVRRAGYGDPAILAGIPDEIAYGEGGAGWVADRREPLVDASVEADARILGRELVLPRGIRAFSGFPVLLGDRLLGVLALGRTGVVALSADDLTLLQTLLGQAAVAIENARLYEEATGAYQELKTAQEQLVLAEKLRALGEMASGVAHDFNNLLAAILGRVQLILRQVTDPTLRRWLGVIEQAALDGAQTVRQIQEFTRVRRDQPTQTVDVNQVVRDAVEMTRPRWHGEPQSRGLDVRLTVTLDPVPPVDGHPAELREVLTNLILNAVDALPEGGSVVLATRRVGERVEVRVTDSGLGMSEAVRRRIFEPFFSTKGPKGTGLGLAMVYGIVSRHGGEVAVESREGAGSTFTVRLPVGRSAAVLAAPPPPLPADAALRILVIDDEPHVREILGDMLRHERHRVVAAEHGAQGLERFRTEPFDLVLTDLAMPGMSGWQVAQEVKALRPEVPVVLVTGWGVEVPPDQLRQSGVDRVMSKPFRFEDVQEVVASLRGQALHS